MSNGEKKFGAVRTEGGVVKTLAEATMAFKTGRTGSTISGPIYQDVHRILEDIRAKRPNTKSFNSKRGIEYGAALKALGEYLLEHPEAAHALPEGLQPYRPRGKKTEVSP